jgi:hypothetical protein
MPMRNNVQQNRFETTHHHGRQTENLPFRSGANTDALEQTQTHWEPDFFLLVSSAPLATSAVRALTDFPK